MPFQFSTELIEHGYEITSEQAEAFLSSMADLYDLVASAALRENGDDDRKLELAKILLSNATMKNKKLQSYQIKMLYQLMLAGHGNRDFSTWLGC